MKTEIVIENLQTLRLFNKKFENVNETIDQAIDLLKKQIPMNVKNAYKHQKELGGYKHRCPRCNEALGYYSKDGHFYESDYYCMNCGQAVNFDDD